MGKLIEKEVSVTRKKINAKSKIEDKETMYDEMKSRIAEESEALESKVNKRKRDLKAVRKKLVQEKVRRKNMRENPRPAYRKNSCKRRKKESRSSSSSDSSSSTSSNSSDSDSSSEDDVSGKGKMSSFSSHNLKKNVGKDKIKKYVRATSTPKKLVSEARKHKVGNDEYNEKVASLRLKLKDYLKKVKERN